jgi:menaquinone-dependent protoporphyrinogen IX oxidase
MDELRALRIQYLSRTGQTQKETDIIYRTLKNIKHELDIRDYGNRN